METLKKRAQFQRVQKGRKWVTPAFVMYAVLRNEEGAELMPRFGFTVSSRAVEKVTGGKKKRGKAVDRNRARRRLKEAVRLSFPVSAAPSFDYVIVGRAAALDRNFTGLLADMRLAFHKVSQLARPDKDKQALS